MNYRQNTVQNQVLLHAPDAPLGPCTEVVLSTGQHFLLAPTGEVAVLVDGAYLPIQHLPAADFQTRLWLRYAPRVVLAALALATFVTGLFWWLYPVSTAVQEATFGIVATFGYWSAMLVGAVALLIVLRAFQIVLTSPRAERASDASHDAPGDVVLVVASLDEHDVTLPQRFEQAIAALNAPGSRLLAVACLRFRDPAAHIAIAGGDARGFNRTNPEPLDLTGEKQWKDTSLVWALESWETFVRYSEWYRGALREWGLKKAHQAASTASDRTTAYINVLRNVATTLAICILASGSLFAQKSYQVETYLGTDRYEAMKPIGKVNFVFEQRVISRKGDGKFSFKQLLPDVAYYSDASDAGKLLRITVDNHPIQPIGAEPSATAPSKADKMLPNPPTQQPSIDPVRPKPLFDNQGQQEQSGHRFQIPDSATVAANLEAAKASVGREMGNITRSAHPVWNFLFWLFQSIQLLLICFIGLMRYYAKSAANEALITAKGRTVVGGWIVVAQQNAAAITLILVWIIAFFLLIDFFIGLMAMGLTPWLLVPIWFLTLKAAEVITDWLVPNLKVSGKHGPMT